MVGIGCMTHRSSVLVWSVCGYLLVRLSVDGWLFAVGLPATASNALAVPLGMLFGLPAAAGLAVGVFVADGLRLAVSAATLIESCSVSLIAAVGHTLWQPVDRSRWLALREPRWWGGFALAGICGVTAGSAFVAWGFELAGLGSFYFVFASSWLALVVGTLVVTPPTLAVVAWRRRTDRRDQSPGDRDHLLDGSSRARLAVGGLPFVWAGLGSLWSLGFQLRQRVPLFAFERLDLASLYYWSEPGLFGRGGRRLQVVVGAVMLTLLFVSLREVHDG